MVFRGQLLRKPSDTQEGHEKDHVSLPGQPSQKSRRRGLNIDIYFLTVLEVEKSKNKVLAGLVSSEASCLDLLPLHMAILLCTYTPSVSLCVRITSQIGLGPP